MGRNLTILQINDLHGYLNPHPEIFDLLRPTTLMSGGGLSRLAAVFGAVRQEVGPAVVALDNGDTFHGTLPAVASRGSALVAPLAALRLDAMTLHWEFAYGLRDLKALTDRLPYPALAANITVSTATVTFRPFTIVERGGLRIGVIGLSAILAPHMLPHDERAQVHATMGEHELTHWVRELRRNHAADLVVVVSHQGFPQDCKLAASVSGIDVLLSGHTHHRMTTPAIINDTIVMQSGAHGSFVGRLDLTMGDDGVANWRHELIAVDERWDPDPLVARLVDQAVRPYDHAAKAVVGATECILHRYGMFDSPMDALLLDATAEAGGTAVALSNGWRYGAPIAAGPLTEADIWQVVPANPAVSVVALSAHQLRELFEANLDATFASDPWEQRGGYMKRSRGIDMTVKLENPKGQRIQDFRVDGQGTDASQPIMVAFLGEQAVPRKYSAGARPVGMSAVEAVGRYLRQHGSVRPQTHGGVTVV